MKNKRIFHVGDIVYLGYISDCSPQNGMSQLILRINGKSACLMFKDGYIYSESDIYREATGIIDKYRLRRRATAETRKIARRLAKEAAA